MHTIARVRDGVVINVESGDDHWLAEGGNGDLLVVYTPANPAGIGWSWDGKQFTPPAEPDLVSD